MSPSPSLSNSTERSLILGDRGLSEYSKAAVEGETGWPTMSEGVVLKESKYVARIKSLSNERNVCRVFKEYTVELENGVSFAVKNLRSLCIGPVQTRPGLSRSGLRFWTGLAVLVRAIEQLYSGLSMVWGNGGLSTAT